MIRRISPTTENSSTISGVSSIGLAQKAGEEDDDDE